MIKSDHIEGFAGFVWDDKDTGAWEGPVADWIVHKETILGLGKRRSVIQAGGNMGLYPCFLSKYFDNVYTFEPDPDNYDILCQNLDRHGIENVAAFNYALGEEPAKQTEIVVINPVNLGMNRIARENEDLSGYRHNQVIMINLDSVKAMFYDVDLLWLDIEGYEMNALLGAKCLIEEHKPAIMVERPNLAMENFMISMGYGRAKESAMDVLYFKK